MTFDIFDPPSFPVTLWGTARKWVPRTPDLTDYLRLRAMADAAAMSPARSMGSRIAAQNRKPREPRESLIGCRYGRLEVVRRDEPRGIRTFWICRCDCGAHVSLRTDRITSAPYARDCGAECPLRKTEAAE